MAYRTLVFLGIFSLTATFGACSAQSDTDDETPLGGSHSGGNSHGTGGKTGTGSTAGTGGTTDPFADLREACTDHPGAVFVEDDDGCTACILNEDEGEERAIDHGGKCNDQGLPEVRVEVGCGYLRETWRGDVGDYGTTIYLLPDDFGIGGAGGVGGAGGAFSDETRVLLRTIGDEAWFGNDDESCHTTYFTDQTSFDCDDWTEVCADF